MTGYGNLIIGYDFTNGEDKSVMIVGTQKDDKLSIVNAFQGPDAEALYEMLTERKDDNVDPSSVQMPRMW